MKERKIDVFLSERFVGTLAETADRRVAFAYSDEWPDSGFAVRFCYLGGKNGFFRE